VFQYPEWFITQDLEDDASRIPRFYAGRIPAGIWGFPILSFLSSSSFSTTNAPPAYMNNDDDDEPTEKSVRRLELSGAAV